MKNKKYPEGGKALRIITDEKGRQLVATKDGVKIPYQRETTFRQNAEDARLGIVHVDFSAYFKKDGFIAVDTTLEIRSDGVYFDEEPMEIQEWKIEINNESPPIGYFKCIAYADTTI